MKSLSWIVLTEESGMRLDVFLTRKLEGLGRAAIRKLIEDAAAKVNNHPAKPSHRTRAGEHIGVVFPEAPAEEPSLKPWVLPLEILYEDEAILAINKPSGIVVHPGAGNREQTFANAIVCLRPEIGSVGHPLRPGIVHRLDKETSGLILVAKTHAAYQTLTRMFKERKMEKHYRALAFGIFEHQQQRIDRALGRDPHNRKKISVRARKSREAITFYRVLQQYEFGALLDVRLLTGRTHQIRVHLSSEGHPVIGDLHYGGGNWNRIRDPQLRASLKEAHFFGLHAFSLHFAHPATGAPLHLEAPLPEVWQKISWSVRKN